MRGGGGQKGKGERKASQARKDAKAKNNNAKRTKKGFMRVVGRCVTKGVSPFSWECGIQREREGERERETLT